MPLSTIFLLCHGSQFCSQKYGIPPGHKTERDMVKQYAPFLGKKKYNSVSTNPDHETPIFRAYNR